ncbi:MAG TPA: S8 family serine peptidase [Gemmatimonadales bacterium]|nr:S8 family serine peptidase [Gemmatimonadales bacterium]
MPAASIELGLSLLRGSGAEVMYVYRTFGAAWVRIDPALGPQLRRHPLIDYIEPRQWFQLDRSPARVMAAKGMLAVQGGQTTPWGIKMVRAPESWSLTTGTGVKTLIIDTGIGAHDDLPAIPPVNCGGGFGGCDDGPFFHGTHVAGIVLARNNAIGVVGVAPGVDGSDLFAWGACDSNTGGCSTTEIAAGIDEGRTDSVKVISMSLHGPFDQGVANAVAQAWQAGIVLVAAAGNHSTARPQDNIVVYPAGNTNVIGVAGVQTDKSFASTSPCPHPLGGQVASNSGSHVDLAAPFWALSTVGSSAYEDERQGWCGTSMATPHVTGAAALLWAQNPTWTNQQVVDRLFATALAAPGQELLVGHGLVDAANAVGLGAPRIGRPLQDVSNTGGFTASSGTALWAMTDEALPDGNTTYVVKEADDGTYTFEVKLTSLADVYNASNPAVMRLRQFVYIVDFPQNLGAVQTTMTLLQGITQIATTTFTAQPGQYTQMLDYALTSAERAAITNPADLRMRVSVRIATQDIQRRGCRVTFIEFDNNPS